MEFARPCCHLSGRTLLGCVFFFFLNLPTCETDVWEEDDIMARIVGPASGHATLTGTSGNDLILAFGDGNTITGGGGNDTIQATSGNDNFIGVGAPMDGLTSLTDVLRLDGNGDTVLGGDENVSVTGDISASDVTLGYGNDTIFAVGSGNRFVLTGGSYGVKALGGNDTVNFSGPGGSGYSDTVVFSGSHNSLDNTLYYGPYPAIGTLDVTGGSGNGTFLLGTTSGTIVTHGVDNYIEGGQYGTKIVAGSGHDTVHVVAGARDTGGDANILLGGTHNLVTGIANGVSVTGGMGYDTLNFDYPGAGASLQITDGGVHDSVSLMGSTATIDGGGSYETVSAVSSVVTMTFTGVSDALYLSGSEGAAGPPSSYVDDLSTGLNIFLENSNSLSNFPSTGNLTIDGFDNTGVIDFVAGRGGFTSTAQVFADLHQFAPNDYTLALPDGTGTITFLNADHLSAANFKLT